MSKWVTTQKKPVLPLYLAGLVWPVCAIIFPLYRLPFLLLTAVLSAGVGLAAGRLCPARVVRTEVPFSTGVEDTDKMLTGIQRDLDALHRLNEAIPDAALSSSMSRMEQAGRSILQEVEAHPDKARQIRRFADYYLPESVKVLSTYAELDEKGVKGANADKIRSDVHANTETIAVAFENQLDALFSSKSMDVSADLTVLDSILKGQGLVD